MKHKNYQFGATVDDQGQTRFRVWAPLARRVVVDLAESGRQVSLSPADDGFFVGQVDTCPAGTQYSYRVDGGPPRPDPASRFQRDGVHGPSEVVDPRFEWTDRDWFRRDHDRLKRNLVVYEMHIGTFTQQGTFLSTIERLDELVDLGVTAIELMPVAGSAGRWNWGYDGVNLFAPFSPYGSPEHLRQLVDAAHTKGLAVIMDVVFNHLGPEGNYLAEFGPYLSDKHNTVWGAAPNFDDPRYGSVVREFIIAAALIWIDEFHMDGLRVDAIHCMRDDSDPHIAIDISRAIRQWSKQSGSEQEERPAILIAESNVYDPNMLAPIESGGVGFDGEWCDDFLHSVFAVVRPGEQLCHRKYEKDDLKQTLETGFIFQGSLREPDQRHPPGNRVDTHGLIYSIQHHDFIGNHPLGKRLHQLTSKETQRAAAALLLLSPGVPMLFMGEEFCCEQPFRFFVDFGDESLRQGVVEGRKREYPQHDWSDGVLPTDPESFVGSKIGAAEDGDIEMRAWYRDLIRLRKSWIESSLLCDQNLTVETDLAASLFVLRYQHQTEIATVAVRLSDDNEAESVPFAADGLLLDSLNPSDAMTPLAPNHAKVFLEKS